MRSTSASFAVRKRTGAWIPRTRSAWQTSRPSASGSPMSITSASGPESSMRSSTSAPVATASTRKPSSRRPRRRTPRSSSSSSTTSKDWPNVIPEVSLLPQDRAEREAPDPQRGQRRRDQPARHGSPGEAREERPRDGQVVGWRVEDVLQHRHEHLGEQPAEQRREREGGDEHERGLAPEECGGAAQRGAESG